MNMKKNHSIRRTYILVSCLICACLSSCTPEAETATKASIVFEEGQSLAVNVAPEGEVIDIRFNSMLEWTTEFATNTPENDWFQIVPSSGKGGSDSVCKIKFTENGSGKERHLTLHILSMDVSKKLLFAQKTLTDDGPQDRPDDDEIEDDDTDDNTGSDNTGNNGTDNDTGDDNVTPPAASGQSGKYGWYELPQFKYNQSGSYMIDATDSDLYYAHHICAGGERGPGGKTARNYTVCFSAEHHCPVWVAAPRHSMYESGASRTNAYGKDPNIPSDIQYNSKSTGGGCNKGHMLGSAERLSTSATNKQVFYYTNIAPQYSDTFNNGGGGWNILEDWVDDQVCSDTLYVVIGAYFDNYTDKRGNSASPKKISFGGRSDVSCPTMFYYILMRTKSGSSGKSLSQCKASEIKCAAFVRSHKTAKGTKVSSQDLMSVSDLEKVTGFTYFPNVPHAPKSTCSASDWGL